MNAIASPARAGEARYRPDIDGLRGVAVLLVVAGHIGVPGVAGGFVGVDVFFAISGFLITRLLMREFIDTQRIDVAAFYARRVRRLLPALAIVIAATLLLGLWLLLPDQQIALAQSAAAASVFAANIYFWIAGTGYFADPAVLLPLQHLWTLAVEEQFYLLWPVVLLMIVRARPRTIAPARAVALALGAVAIVSLALSVALAASAPEAAFFLLPTRAWEIAAGALLVLAPAVSPGAARWLGLVGLAAIAGAAVSFNHATPFPSFYAILPIAGAMAILASGEARGDRGAARLLASTWLVAIGRVSYGWYLWHWPLLSLARNVYGTEPALGRDAALALAALAAAAAMHRWVEMPVRTQRVAMFSGTRVSLAAGLATLFFCAISSGALLAWGRRPLPAASILAQYTAARGGAARDFPFCDGPATPRCEMGRVTSTPTILLWGDSHAAQLSAGLDRAARLEAVKVIARTKGGCSPGGFPDSGPDKDAAFWTGCAAFNASVIASLPALRDNGVRGVIIAGDWLDRRRGWDRQLEADIAAMRRLGLRVLLVGAIPILPADFVDCAVARGAEACAQTRVDVERQEPGVAPALARLAAENSDVRIWSPLDALCPNARCPSVLNRQLLYRGRNHLTIAGSASLAPSLFPAVAWLAGAPPTR